MWKNAPWSSENAGEEVPHDGSLFVDISSESDMFNLTYTQKIKYV